MTPDQFSIHNKIEGYACDGHVFLTLYGHQNAILDPTEARWLAETLIGLVDLLEGKEPAQPLDLETSVAKLRKSLRGAMRKLDKARAEVERLKKGPTDG